MERHVGQARRPRLATSEPRLGLRWRHSSGCSPRLVTGGGGDCAGVALGQVRLDSLEDHAAWSGLVKISQMHCTLDSITERAWELLCARH